VLSVPTDDRSETATISASNAHFSPVTTLFLLALVAIAMATAAWAWQARANDFHVAIVTLAIVCGAVSALAVGVMVATSGHRVGTLLVLVERLNRSTRFDPLTGVANRGYLEERLRNEVHRAARFGHPLSIAMIDIDDFKRVNDTFGHQAGDEALRTVARIIERELRSIDVVGRYGGEEFLAILPETPLDGAVVAMNRMRSAVERAQLTAGVPSRLTVSAGVASHSVHGWEPEDLVRSADDALYIAKHRGKNQVVAGS
jgi:diguanylate cyclase (GGDEF)-like protein